MTGRYQIKVKGQLDPQFSAWFEGCTISHTPEDDTLISGVVIDQAALYGLLARCRDLGLTLISVNPLSLETGLMQATTQTLRKEKLMKAVRAEVSKVIAAPAEAIYAVISDYQVGHPAILPKPWFGELFVEKGGKGAGTVIRFQTKVMGVTQQFHQLVTEPQPGRVLLETDIETGQWSRFTLEPLDGGAQTRVTITAEFPLSGGFKGFMERLMNPPIARRMFKQELENLAAYVAQQRAQQGGQNAAA